mmetsp:Transcript_91022/g.220927  ORF Transcript_91022/g.220927 Transcript_91022/m.220927 type:complete len:336 (-) Transcript_91022:233-1240(-)
MPALQRLADPRNLPLHAARGGGGGHLREPHEQQGGCMVCERRGHPRAAPKDRLSLLADPDLGHGRRRRLPLAAFNSHAARLQLLSGQEDPLLRRVAHSAHHLLARALRHAQPRPREALGRELGGRRASFLLGAAGNLATGGRRQSEGRDGQAGEEEGRRAAPAAGPRADPAQGRPAEPVQPLSGRVQPTAGLHQARRAAAGPIPPLSLPRGRGHCRRAGWAAPRGGPALPKVFRACLPRPSELLPAAAAGPSALSSPPLTSEFAGGRHTAAQPARWQVPGSAGARPRLACWVGAQFLAPLPIDFIPPSQGVPGCAEVQQGAAGPAQFAPWPFCQA